MTRLFYFFPAAGPSGQRRPMGRPPFSTGELPGVAQTLQGRWFLGGGGSERVLYYLLSRARNFSEALPMFPLAVRFAAAGILLILALASFAAFQPGPADPKPLTDEQRAKRKERDRWDAETSRLEEAGK